MLNFFTLKNFLQVLVVLRHSDRFWFSCSLTVFWNHRWTILTLRKSLRARMPSSKWIRAAKKPITWKIKKILIKFNLFLFLCKQEWCLSLYKPQSHPNHLIGVTNARGPLPQLTDCCSTKYSFLTAAGSRQVQVLTGSVTRWGDLLVFGQLFKACGNN